MFIVAILQMSRYVELCCLDFINKILTLLCHSQVHAAFILKTISKKFLISSMLANKLPLPTITLINFIPILPSIRALKKKLKSSKSRTISTKLNSIFKTKHKK